MTVNLDAVRQRYTADPDVLSLADEVATMRALFDLQWRRMTEATARWRAEDPDARAQVMPDLGALLQWLMGEQDRRHEAKAAAVIHLQAELDRAITRANHNARLAADERDVAAQRERERIADWFAAEGDHWRIKNNTEARCEYDHAAQMIRDGAGGGGL